MAGCGVSPWRPPARTAAGRGTGWGYSPPGTDLRCKPGVPLYVYSLRSCGGTPSPTGEAAEPGHSAHLPALGLLCRGGGVRLQEGGRPGQARPGQRQLQWRKSGSPLPLRAWGISPRPTVLEKGRPGRPGRWVGPGGDLDSDRKPSPGRQGRHQEQWKPPKLQEKSLSLNFPFQMVMAQSKSQRMCQGCAGLWTLLQRVTLGRLGAVPLQLRPPCSQPQRPGHAAARPAGAPLTAEARGRRPSYRLWLVGSSPRLGSCPPPGEVQTLVKPRGPNRRPHRATQAATY